ncbi:MAG: hypothetical protein JWQ48_1710 [Conexibacter sp.]|nr:hypothetical protein [Conexibacter sp.]
MAHGSSVMINPRRHAGAAAVLAGLALAALAAAPASAAAPPPSKPAFSLAPVGSSGALLLHGAPGRTVSGSVRVRNVSAHSVTVLLKGADVQNASNGNADYVTTKLSSTGRWLQLATTTVRLAPHASHDVAFTASIPTSARGASHYAGIVAVDAKDLASAAAHRPTKRGFSFARVSRQALPLTIRLPGPLSRRLVVRSITIDVEPVGAGLVLGLLPGGSDLIQSAAIRLRVMRGTRIVFRHASTLGQLFPGAILNYRVPWSGRPVAGSYHVVGVIRPRDAAAVPVDQTVTFTPAKVAELKHEATPAAQPPRSRTPPWVWFALAAGAALLLALSLAVWKLARRPVHPAA